ncbi:MAG: GNAT family N-acetyltransferase [Proteobacteria bacterium]|nr:GNAT family N-acetyltransferase [Pseudomonadota bacterium]
MLEIGWGIHPAFQRRGPATKAARPVLDDVFNRRRIDRLVAITDPGNRGSRALIGRLGFAFDADVLVYGAAQVRYVLDREVYLGGG